MIANHLWQSTLFAIAVMLSAYLLRRHRPDVRRRLWLAASMKFLIPFTVFTSIAGQFHWQAVERRVSGPVTGVIAQWNEPFYGLQRDPL